MELHELVIEMKQLERRLTRFDEYDETRADFSRWKGVYETWLRRKKAYTEQLKRREFTDALRVQPSY
jgi:hypothetical protein